MGIECRSVCLSVYLIESEGLFLERCSGWDGDGVEGEDRRGVGFHVGEWDKELGRSIVALICFPGPSTVPRAESWRSREEQSFKSYRADLLFSPDGWDGIETTEVALNSLSCSCHRYV